MSNINNKQPKLIYQLEGDELERIITRAVTDVMERYTSNITPSPAAKSGDLMSVEEVCNLLHVTPATLNNWHKLKYLTKVKVGRRVLYHRSDVEELAAHTEKTSLITKVQ